MPEARRAFRAQDAFSLWFSLGIGLLVLQAGAFLVPGLSLGMALAAIVTGSVLGALLLAAAGVVGTDTGLSSMGALRLALGARGAAVPAVLNAIQLTGWGAFEIIAMRDSADALAKQTFGFSSPVIWTLAFGLLATFLAIQGPVSFVRRFLRAWGLWLLLAGAGWLSWRLLAEHDLSALLARAGTGEMSFGAGVDLVVAMPLSWLPLIADYTRFGRTSGGMFKGSAAGYVLANIWFMALGAAYALAAGGGESLFADGPGGQRRRDRPAADRHRRDRQHLRRHPFGRRLDRHARPRQARQPGPAVRRAVHDHRPLRADHPVRRLPAADRLSVRAAVRRAAGRPLRPAPSRRRRVWGRREPARPAGLGDRHRRLSSA
ncbi:cytosine permease [Caulobacter sp. UC70_42]|uniref:cytosine permease n=1 Tax=Caulobacter sp. UC70_42 TaxID=3374551 RepID=UPI0037564E94